MIVLNKNINRINFEKDKINLFHLSNHNLSTSLYILLIFSFISDSKLTSLKNSMVSSTVMSISVGRHFVLFSIYPNFFRYCSSPEFL